MLCNCAGPFSLNTQITEAVSYTLVLETRNVKEVEIFFAHHTMKFYMQFCFQFGIDALKIGIDALTLIMNFFDLEKILTF